MIRYKYYAFLFLYMSDLKDDSMRSGSRPTYSPPRVIRMSNFSNGNGQEEAACATLGSSATQNCNSGATALKDCNANGQTAVAGKCLSTGSRPGVI